MGRQAKYLTLQDRLSAQCAQKANHARTDKGCAMRKIHNYTTYARSHRRRRAKDSHANTFSNTTIPLPSMLTTLATSPLPTSNLFHAALHGVVDSVDESDLLQWDCFPPYPSPEPPNIPAEVQSTSNLVDVLHGQRCRLERERYNERAQMLRVMGSLYLVEALKDELRRMEDQWYTVRDILKTETSGTRHKKMCEHHLQWCSRGVFARREELSVLLNDGNLYNVLQYV
ncbi:hypothetical protein BJ138DRAFT_1120284 [Hygrophoropsis aurantiaca]|uniref:Uncharacterized protein n=1 Tax=Hygrophoropsis aurantiaca TaxID=72124 RepID=A0ACB7ZQW4_9AGAM|nr:hypothetical protein BJ138DRAFT_1120284 [Hygrophoropsis aurantiaca]